MYNRSRLTRRLEQQSKKNLILSMLGIVVALFLLVQYGLPMLINLGVYISGNKTADVQEKKSIDFLAPPLFDTPYTATNSAKIKVTGTSSKEYKIKLYVNDEVFDTTQVDDSGIFTFENVVLQDGDNHLQAIAINDKKNESKKSDDMVIAYKKKDVTLTIDSPNNDQKFAKEEQSVTVSGKTDKDNKVTINDLWAIVNSDGKFTYTLPLRDGDMTIKIVASDGAGNQKVEERKVNRSQ